MNFSNETEHFILDQTYRVIIFSDAHFWPKDTSPAFWILLKVIEKFKPDVVIDNGDAFDGASISRFPKKNFGYVPTVKEEIEAVKLHKDLIEAAVGADCSLYWNIGNHDERYEAMFTQKLPEANGFSWTNMREYFPKWKQQYTLLLNGEVEVRHRLKGGIHAAFNNVRENGLTIVTGHTHKLTVREFTNRRGTMYGIETGTLANTYGKQFSYCDDSVRNWQQGFICLTVVPEADGTVNVYPEKVFIEKGKTFFRGKVISG